jgi:hypothetical protein
MTEDAVAHFGVPDAKHPDEMYHGKQQVSQGIA